MCLGKYEKGWFLEGSEERFFEGWKLVGKKTRKRKKKKNIFSFFFFFSFFLFVFEFFFFSSFCFLKRVWF